MPATTKYESGVRWSGMSDEPTWTPSPEAQAKAHAAYVKALAKMEAEVAAYAASKREARREAA